jgi:Fe-S-cluster containining protein
MGFMPQRADGACINLAEDNTCNIYETRPDICRVDKMSETTGQTLGMNKIEYFKFASKCCNKMIENQNLDKKYLINVDLYIEENGTDSA